MTVFWKNLSIQTRRLLITAGILMSVVIIGMQFHVSSQGDVSETYPKGFRGGTCTIETDSLLVGYSAYFIPADYAVPENALSAMSIPILCGKVPGTGLLNITIDLLYPVSAHEQLIALDLLKKSDSELNQTILSIPPRSYQSGTISQEIRIDESGEYMLRLSGINQQQLPFNLEIPITVGTKWYEFLLQLWPLVLLCTVPILLYGFKRIIH